MRTKEANPVDAKKEDDIPDYEVKDAFDTIMRAHEIMGNTSKMEKVHALAGRHHKAVKALKRMKPIKSTADLKEVYDEKFGSGALKKLHKSAAKGD